MLLLRSNVEEGPLATKDYYEWWLKISCDLFSIGTKTLVENMDLTLVYFKNSVHCKIIDILLS